MTTKKAAGASACDTVAFTLRLNAATVRELDTRRDRLGLALGFTVSRSAFIGHALQGAFDATSDFAVNLPVKVLPKVKRR